MNIIEPHPKRPSPTLQGIQSAAALGDAGGKVLTTGGSQTTASHLIQTEKQQQLQL